MVVLKMCSGMLKKRRKRTVQRNVPKKRVKGGCERGCKEGVKSVKEGDNHLNNSCTPSAANFLFTTVAL